MEQNQLPSSPLQHHHPNTRPQEPSSQDPEPPKLNLPPSSSNTLTRPNSSHTNNTASLGWSEQDRHYSDKVVVKVKEQPWGRDSTTWPEAGPSTQPLGTSSRVPSPAPQSEHIDIPSTAELDLPPQSPSSSLLTSEPLNRSSSDQSFRLSRTFSPINTMPPHKRARAASLPPPIPIFKRRKAYHPDAPPPSETYGRTLVPLKQRPSKLEIQQGRAAAWLRTLRSHRQWSTPIGSSTVEFQVIVASRQPPINLTTLKSLDAHEILKTPQLRHDLLFDNIAFRPVSSSFPLQGISSPNTEIITPGPPGPPVDPTTTSIVADMYWQSVAEEIATGCRCTRWKVSGEANPNGPGALAALENKEREPKCHCGRWRMDLTESEWWKYQSTRSWPSRLPDLVRTLREILISLMGSTTPCPNHFAHSFSREALDAHESTCPTVTHALVPELYTALDADFLTLQIRRGVLGVGLFQLIGEAMKVHCAPLRDAMVDGMIATAAAGLDHPEDITLALRKCFDCVEVMKLDIANHQVHALRPYLWNTAAQYELSAFHNHLTAEKRTLEISTTREWIRPASLKVVSEASPTDRLHLIGKCGCASNNELVIRTFAEGFMELLYRDWSGGKIIPARASKQMGQGWLAAGNAVFELPESLKMDVKRFRAFHAEMMEMVILSILVDYWGFTISSEHYPDFPRLARISLLQDLRVEIEMLFTSIGFESAIRRPSDGAHSEIAIKIASHLVIGISCGGEEYRRQVDRVALTIDGLISQHLHPSSEIWIHCSKRIRSTITLFLLHDLLSTRADPSFKLFDPVLLTGCTTATGKSTFGYPNTKFDEELELDLENDLQLPLVSTSFARGVPPPSAAQEREQYNNIKSNWQQSEIEMLKKNGLYTIDGHIRNLVGKMSRIAGFNLSVFFEIYRKPGMIVGS